MQKMNKLATYLFNNKKRSVVSLAILTFVLLGVFNLMAIINVGNFYENIEGIGGVGVIVKFYGLSLFVSFCVWVSSFLLAYLIKEKRFLTKVVRGGERYD